jgi:dienelactone hydrolase
MKKSLLFLGISLITVGVLAPFRACAASGEASELGSQFVDLLAKGDFAAAAARYDNAMRTALPEPKLRATWQGLEKQAGRFKKRIQTRALKAGEYDVALVTCEFERARLDAKVVFNARKEVSGLFFLPSTAGVDQSAPPPYARTNAFREEEFTVGKGEWRLPATLTLPSNGAGPWPAVVLVHGSGPNDRDETIGGLKPFRDLAWGLASKGIAVLRYEKRTKEYGAKFGSLMVSGKLANPLKEEVIDDAVSAVSQLREMAAIDPKRVFVLGHSLGGTIAPRIGEADPRIAGLIIMAGATRPIEDLVVQQTRYLRSLNGEMSAPEQESLREIESQAAIIKKLTAADASSSKMFLGAPAAYWLDLRAHDPVAEARALKQPLLILQGGRDYQVTTANFDDWKKGLSAMPNVSFKLYPRLNHLFVAGEGKSTPQEYEKAGNVAEPVVADIADWILKTH